MDLTEPIRNAIIGETGITSLLQAYQNGWPVFTRRPIPEDAPSIVIIVSPDITVDGIEDGVSDDRPIIVRDISVYGPNDTAASYRKVELICSRLRTLFHARRTAITVPSWAVVQITVNGPQPAPVDDEENVGRLVSLNVQLAATR